MQTRQKPFTPVAKKFHPRGLSIVYEDHDIIVADKMSGLLTVSSETVKENTAFFLLNDYVRKGNQKSKNRVFIVHRLDKDTSGLIVFAKSEEARRYLQDEWQNFSKRYYAVVHGTLTEKEGIISSYLTENAAHKVYSTPDREKGKLARTGYRVAKESPNFSLLEIDLLTGRKNQIRVHLAEKGYPLAGDKVYGPKNTGIKRLALHSTSLMIRHPYSKEEMVFTTKVPPYLYSLLKETRPAQPTSPRPATASGKPEQPHSPRRAKPKVRPKK